jgi:hypothetical protein
VFTSLQGGNKAGFTFDGTAKASEANGQYSASSSGSHEDLYPGSVVPGKCVLLFIVMNPWNVVVPMLSVANIIVETYDSILTFLVPGAATDDTAGKTVGKRFAGMLGSIPAPPAMASEFPPATGKSVGALSAVSPSSIRVTAGIIQLDGLSFTGASERWPLQKNGDFSLLLSFTVESDMSAKAAGFEQAARMSAVPMVLRSSMYLFFVSAMILVLSYKIGSCIYSR